MTTRLSKAVKWINSTSSTVLLLYKHNNLLQLVKLLIDNGVDVAAKEPKGWTAIYFLCRYYAHDNLFLSVKLWIEKEADVTAEMFDGWTALHYLFQHYTHNNLIHVAKLLIENGANTNA